MEGYPYTACAQKLHNHWPANYKQWEYSAETSWDRDIQLPSSRLWPFTTAQCKGVRPHMSLASKIEKWNFTCFGAPILQLSSSHPPSKSFGRLCLCLCHPWKSPSTLHPQWLQAHPRGQQSARRFASPVSPYQASHGLRSTSPPPVQVRDWDIICKICRRQKRKHDKNVSPVSLINYNYDIRLASRDDCAAKWIGCTPFLSGQVAGALAASNNFTTSTWPFMHAAWSGVRVPVLPCKTVGIFKKAWTRAIAPNPAPCCRISISVSSSNVSRPSVSSRSWKKLSR